VITTRLTQVFGLKHPIIAAPMALASGGRLASAVTQAGGLGLIGGGYCDPDWIAAEFANAGNIAVGCGFITWALAEQPGLLEDTLARGPKAIFLSFGDPMPFAGAIHDADVPLICQVQTLKDARRAVEAGARVIVAQGAEAGGHGESRATLTLVPEIADMLAATAPETLLCAAGGISDGRGLAAALMLGADGVVVGSRLWASDEALVHPNMLAQALAADGDGTLRSSVMDIARGKTWPDRYSCRVLKNDFTDRWHGAEDGLRADPSAGADWTTAWGAGNTDVANTFVGEGAGLIGRIQPAADILNEMVAGAEAAIRRGVGLTDTA